MRLCVLVARITVKRSNHKIRSPVLLLSLMWYAFIYSGSENYNRNRKCRKRLRNLSHGCRCASWQTFRQLQYFTTFYFLSCWLVAMAVLKAIVSLYRAGEEKPIERYKTRVKVAEENNYFRRSKKILSSFLGSTSKLKSSAWGHLTWNFTAWRKSMAKRRITP